ncbi:hypothetical protein PC41400_08100 [Paenibacillus chitinolyticus]|uniref:Uncharacterized protein n=2 Tax=Paenibacillus chitinolyticus TaxID=79263 RepID=A0A410WTC6_9BACL|nr:hypothetical protein [Paenibacillus chitinolyticus]MCY9599131.1 hypothetical protein [Paenibacillus chitinolyticus]QAV17628.1 hypothetical protein PC41400_08100 [Paenibacillus chitinolyticus]
MTNEDFIKAVRQIVNIELKENNLAIGHWHLGTVMKVKNKTLLSISINGSATSQDVPCNPDVNFIKGDLVYVVYVNGDSKNKFVPYKRFADENYTGNSVANQVLGNLSLNHKEESGLTAPYNFTVIQGTRGGVQYSELWILVNAYYDYKTKRFKRKNVNNYSFGWQFQGMGTYPGEENFGDYSNQGVNLWKANGKSAYGVNDPARDMTNEDIGAVQSDGSWREFGIMLGWNNVFMCDSYGGMTIGGAGFEIDGNGTSPFKRVSLNKFNGGSVDSSKEYEQYGYAYNGNLWNAFHGMHGSDQNNRNSFFWGLVSPIDFYDQGYHNPYSNQASMEEVKFVLRMKPKNVGHQAENWKDIMSMDMEGNMKLKERTVSATLVANATVNGTDFNFNYPDSTWNKSNTFIAGVIGVQSNGSLKQFGAINATFTDFGAYGYLGEGFVSAKILISKY